MLLIVRWLALFALVANSITSAAPQAAGPVLLFSDGLESRIVELQDPKTGQYGIPNGFDEWLRKIDTAIGNDLVREMFREKGIDPAKLPKSKVGILDTGILSAHPRLQKLVTESVDFSGEGPGDRNGHGTMVAMILAHQIFTPLEIVDIKTVPSSGRGEYRSLISALDWALNKNFNSLNMSLGVYLPCVSVKIDKSAERSRMSCERQEICQKIRAFREGGTLIFAAVGNEVGRVACPACCEASVAVGSSKLNTGADVRVPN